ncbi:fungal-specific transcription factor domain-containing protein [Hypoxylon trugodes]|uniref:fungal-specific transcription factor domain-containing protein n=1 Tax=Hypoxylon trugodes TaxID=326681 RepID=UPI00218EA6B4|nr:fungal-specific transcription factor domain-containing protein [Hypoxylon trugodes]KAI1385375.1 fungal-specific transcription factor domain-containing protein [Hypoxylon trugodes]
MGNATSQAPKLKTPLRPKSSAVAYDKSSLMKIEPNYQNPIIPLLDPLLQGLGHSARYYLNYYAIRFCQDLVLYDSPQCSANPFRDLVPMSLEYPFLREIIVAASALHFSNSMRWNKNPQPVVNALVDALGARHRAIKSLQDVVERQEALRNEPANDGERDALLAAVLFFVNFVLLDSGKGGWRAHMNFVGKLLSLRTTTSSSLRNSPTSAPELWSDQSPLLDFAAVESLIALPPAGQHISSSTSPGIRDYIASDSVAYYIWSNALDSLVSSLSKTTPPPLTFDGDDDEILHILIRTEANSYHSCPSRLLHTVFRTSRLARDIGASEAGVLTEQQMQSCLELLREIQTFDGDAWATEVCTRITAAVGYMDDVEVQYRKHIAATFRAAVCLYVLLVAPELPNQLSQLASSNGIGEDNLPVLPSAEELVATILHHLSLIPTDSPLFKFATWPIFLTGVATADSSRRAWLLDRLRDMRYLCPWGMVTSTMETLVEIWQMRDNIATTEEHNMGESGLTGESMVSLHERDRNNWLVQLKGFKIDCLIV